MGSTRRKKRLTAEEEIEIFESIFSSQNSGVLGKIKVDIKPKTQNQRKLINEIRNKEITICSGPAGSGKTFISCAVSLDLLKNDERYNKIVIVKSVTTLKNEEIGFLKGTMKDKMEPYIYSFLQNFEKIIGKFNVDTLRASNMIEELPIAFMRGINIDNAIVIIDECQNISIDNIRTIMTRIGENSKMIFLGDNRQIDIKNKQESSLDFIIEKFKDVEEIGTVQLLDEDVVRNPLIKKIEKIFNCEGI